MYRGGFRRWGSISRATMSEKSKRKGRLPQLLTSTATPAEMGFYDGPIGATLMLLNSKDLMLFLAANNPAPLAYNFGRELGSAHRPGTESERPTPLIGFLRISGRHENINPSFYNDLRVNACCQVGKTNCQICTVFAWISHCRAAFPA